MYHQGIENRLNK